MLNFEAYCARWRIVRGSIAFRSQCAPAYAVVDSPGLINLHTRSSYPPMSPSGFASLVLHGRIVPTLVSSHHCEYFQPHGSSSLVICYVAMRLSFCANLALDALSAARVQKLACARRHSWAFWPGLAPSAVNCSPFSSALPLMFDIQSWFALVDAESFHSWSLPSFRLRNASLRSSWGTFTPPWRDTELCWASFLRSSGLTKLPI